MSHLELGAGGGRGDANGPSASETGQSPHHQTHFPAPSVSSEEADEARRFVDAIGAFLRPTSDDAQQKAHEHLLRFRKQRFAWRVCQLVARTPAMLESDVLHFALQTLVQLAMRGKWQQQADAWSSDATALLPLAAQLQSDVLQRHVMRAITALWLRHGHIETLYADLEALHAHIGGVPASESQRRFLWFYLLESLPELVANKLLMVAPQRRTALQNALRESIATLVFSELMACLDHESVPLQLICGVARAWIEGVGVAWEAMQHLLGRLANGLHTILPLDTSQETLQIVVEVFVAVLESNSTVEVVGTFMASVIGFPTAAAQPALVHLATTCGRRALIFLEDPRLLDLWPPLLQIIITATQARELSVSSACLDFWEVFALELKGDQCQRFEPVLQSVFAAILAACEYPSDILERDHMFQDEFTDVREQGRAALRATIKANPGIASWFAQHLRHELGTALAAIEAGDDAWSLVTILHLEGLLHALSACCKLVFPTNTTSDVQTCPPEVAQELCAATLRLPLHPCLQRTLVLALGMIWPWLAHYPALYVDVGRHCIQTLALPEEDANFPMRLMEDHVASVALLKLVQGPDAGAIFVDLFHAWQQQAARPTMAEASRRLLVQACVQAALRASQPEEPCMTLLTALVERASEVVQAHDLLGPAAWADIDTAQELSAILAELVAAVRGIHLPAAAAFMSDLFRGPHFILALLFGGPNSGPCQLSEILDQLQELAFATLGIISPPSASTLSAVLQRFWLYFARINFTSAPCLRVIAECIDQGALHHEGLDAPLHELLALLRNREGLVQAYADAGPDTVEALFCLFQTVARTHPQYLLHQPELAIDLLIHHFLGPTFTAVLQHRPVISAALGYVEACAARSPEGSPSIFDVALEHRPTAIAEIVATLLSALCLIFPSHMLEDTVATFRRLMQPYSLERVGEWVAWAINQPAFPRYSVSATAKQIFAQEVVQALQQPASSRLKGTIKQFCGGKKKGTSGTPSRTTSAERAYSV
ncbi:uncharacterized protein MONBRDRAFT_5354 [Monosiga brevicollis MX1]|uniref:Exportin-1/Importin-beta-like domain-containing protein n=1 Tax=Monosiga brevicollis TaxID=81824 RepID=A9UQR0_MONBE|nr:uncharacterized protein MONBRDRAFT_5354 [Monosiga brevicollis MX1]EDQ92640.1 predicted protein [Monosiga brevicollis MX1]|eukprot:XP_001742402.1 hypothetical protein [Monosiga brevicollis MX1]